VRCDSHIRVIILRYIRAMGILRNIQPLIRAVVVEGWLLIALVLVLGGGGGGGGVSPGLPAFVAQRAVSVVVFRSGNTETEESRHVDRIPRTAVRAQVQVQACVGDIDEVEQERTYTSNRAQRSTLSIQV